MSTSVNPNLPSISVAFLEDDLIFAGHISRELEELHYAVTHFRTGQACLFDLMTNDYDVCLLDWNLPDIPGTEVMARLRKIGRIPPTIFITGHDSEEDVSAVLLSGADDYIIKPVVVGVLHARIQALVRRARAAKTPLEKESLGHLTVDYQNKVILSHGEVVALTGSESLLAFYLFMHRGNIVMRQDLYKLLGLGEVAVDTRRLDVHISHLRGKLSLNATTGWKLTSIYQRGYRLEYLEGAKQP